MVDQKRRNTPQRQLVLDIVRARCDHPTADAVYLAARARNERVSRGTVYRNLNLLADEGAIQIIKTPGGNRYDGRCDAHAHAICTSCGAVEDIELPYHEELDRHAASRSSYVIQSHFTFFEGLCPACQARLERTVPDHPDAP